GVWQGNLAGGAGVVAPGGIGTTGTLRVDGDYSTQSGKLLMDVGASGHDVLQVTGTANFSGTLQVSVPGNDGQIAPLVPVQLIDAAHYTGTFNTFIENLDGSVIFNPLNGSITRLGGDDAFAVLKKATVNEVSTWAALYDDVVDPGTKNVFLKPGQGRTATVTGGIESAANPDLLWALTASITPDGVGRALLNRLSPEVYLSLNDYAIEATRAQRRAALDAPALASGAVGTPSSSNSGGGKEGKGSSVQAAPAGPLWEFFATADYFDGRTSGSVNQANYGLNGGGVVAGVRYIPNSRLRFAAYLAGNEGNINGSLIKADADGLAGGLLGEWIFQEANQIRLSGGISYGGYRYDGSRGSASATSAGWSPALASFSGVDTDAVDVFLGIDAVAWKNERFRLIPSLGLSYTTASTDGFRELGRRGDGGPLTLTVDDSHRDALAGELSLTAQADLTRALMVDGVIGGNLDLNHDPERITATFNGVNGGSRPLAARGTPLSDEMLFIGAGATWTAQDNLRFRLSYRLEFRQDADPFSIINLGTTFRF
ncbi:MAG: hypothetical protein JWO82_1038, partial [Akkermansiaceae bacterium]|nr:hypothetical protein [Akkermansiaceae bacterium]